MGSFFLCFCLCLRLCRGCSHLLCLCYAYALVRTSLQYFIKLKHRKSQFWRYYLSLYILVFVSMEIDISNTRDSVSSSIKTPQISLKKIPPCASYFQLSSRFLETDQKHSLSCLIYYLKSKRCRQTNFAHFCPNL